MSLVRFARRSLAVTAAALIAVATLVPEDADARAGRGGSMGSRGSRTYDAAPPTATAPGGQQIQRSQTEPGPNVGAPSAQRPAAQPAAPAAPGRMGGLFGGGLMGGIMGGLLGAGLFGLLSGSGFLSGLGSLASLLGLLIQVVLVVLVVRFAINWFRRRREQGSASHGSPYSAPAAAGAGPTPVPTPASYQGAAEPAPAASTSDRFDHPSRAGVPPVANSYGGGDHEPAGEVAIQASDYDAFERLLKEVQDAWSRQDMGALRTLATPEMHQMFADDLAEMSRDGVVNRVTDVKLLQGDLAESWRETSEDYATVAMRYELIDVTEDVRTREVVDGDPQRPTEATELWTFVRPSQGGDWRVSAVQQAEEPRKSGGWFG